MSQASHWSRYQKHFVRYSDLGFSIDISRMAFADDLFATMAPGIERALKDMKALEAGGIANPDEQRMVGHYWLRNPELAPTAELKAEITGTLDATLKFAEETELPLKAHTFDHPFPIFSTLNAYQWLIYIPLHNVRHNKQIAEVRANANFPKK